MPRLITVLLTALAFLATSPRSTTQAPGKKTPPPNEVVKEAKQKPVKGKQNPKVDPVKGEAKKGEPKKDAKGEPKKDVKEDERDEIKTKDAAESDIPIPEGATEDDIRAIRGANAMKRTEEKFAELLKKMKVPGNVPLVKFDDLDSWPYEDGYKGMPKELAKYDGKKVAMAGFMLPIDEVENIKTFYLVKSLWSCCYGIPPDVNGLVKINVKAKKGVAYQWDPILIVGTFRMKKVMDEDYVICIWQMDDATVRVIEVD